MRTETDMQQDGLAGAIVASEPMHAGGASGNTLERVTLADGRVLVRKKVSPEWDWLSRATGDRGRALAMWDAGVFDDIPAPVDHATVGVEADGPEAWSVYMRDVSQHLVAPDRRLRADEVKRVIGALAQMHQRFLGATLPELCTLVDRYHLLSPRTARREIERDNNTGSVIGRCWETFADLAPSDVAGAIVELAEDPSPLAAELAKQPQTLIHGDVRLSNLGLSDDAVVLVDWGERTGAAPGAVELASFLAFDAKHLDIGRDDVLNEYRASMGGVVADAEVDLAMIGGFVQLGIHHVLDVVLRGDEESRRSAERELAWWSGAVRAAFERTWAPN